MRELIRHWLDVAVDAVDPRRLTFESLTHSGTTHRTVIAIGKAAPAMCQGAADALGEVGGVCVAAAASDSPKGVELLVGDHPLPGVASLEAGRRVLEVARQADDGCIALISGGGSSLCEWPRRGIELPFIQEASRRLLMTGSSIEEMNLVRGHLSEIKCGGLARANPGGFLTLVLSDVAGAGPEVVASGPTLDMAHDPARAMAILESIGMTIPSSVADAIQRAPTGKAPASSSVEVIGDGQKAALAVYEAAIADGLSARINPIWLRGEPALALEQFIEGAGHGLTIGAGETAPRVVNGGRGGRNTHAALLAAKRIAGTKLVFSAFATDGVDGSSGAAGSIVDGDTVARGGIPDQSLAQFDSANYLERTGDLIVTGPTGTNVADLWLLWRP